MKINITTLSKKRILIFSALMLIFALIGSLFVWAWTSSQNAAQLEYRLGTAEAGMAQSDSQIKTVLARQLSAQAQLIFALDNSKQMTAVLLSTESMRLAPSIEAAQVLQNNLLAYPLLGLENGVQLYGNQSVNLVKFSHDGKYLVSLNSYGNTARVWDVETGTEVAHMTHDLSVLDADISPDDKYVVSASDGGNIRVWELKTGQEITRIYDNVNVWSVSFSPDGKYVITDTGDIWNALTGKEVILLPEDEDAIVFSPDGKYILSGGKYQYGKSDNKNDLFFVREIATGREVTHITHNSRVAFAKFSADGKLITSAGCEKAENSGSCVQSVAVVWDVQTGKQIVSLTIDDAWFIDFSPDGQYALSTGRDNIVRLWDVNTGKEISHVAHMAGVSQIQFSPNGKYVASGSFDGTAHVWEILTGEEIAYMPHTKGVGSVAFSPDGKYLATGGGDNFARLWKIDARHEVARMEQDDQVSLFAISPNGRYVAIASRDNIIHVREISNGREVSQTTNTPIEYASDLASLAFSPDSRYIVSGSYSATIRIWEIDTGKEVVRMKYELPIEPFAINPITTLHNFAVKSVAFSPDGRYVLSRSDDHTARVWDVNTGEEISRVTHESGVAVVVFSPNGKYVLSGGCDKMELEVCVQGSARVWDALTGSEIARMTHDYTVSALAFSPDGKYVVSGGDMTARVWEALTGREITRKTYKEGTLAVAFSPDSKYALSTSGYAMDVWEANTRREIAHMEYHWEVFRSVAFSPDGRYVISGDMDSDLRIWEIATGQVIAHFTYNIPTNFVTFGSHGEYLAVTDKNTIYVWTWRPEDLLADACLRVTRNLTRAEWQQYIGATLPYHAVCPNLPIEPEPTPTPNP